MKKIPKILTTTAIAVILTFGLTVSLQSFLNAWTEPTQLPPNGATIPLSGKWQDGQNLPEIHFSDGYVGIGTDDPRTRLEVTGSLRLGSDNDTCDGTTLGVMRFNGTSLQSCDGTDWTDLGSGGGSTPAGAVTAFYQATCPSGWKAADGTDGTPDLRGMFIRGLNDFGTGVRSDGGQDPNGAGRTYNDGLYQDDELQSHTHSILSVPTGAAWVANQFNGVSGSASPHNTSATGGLETRPKNVALIYCVKESGSTPVDDALFDDLGALVLLRNNKNMQVDGTLTANFFVGDGSGLTNVGGAGKWQDGPTAGEIFYNINNVGIGTNNPRNTLDVAGSIRLGSDSSICDASNVGVIHWDGSNFQGCDGTDWVDFGSGGGGGFDLVNGQHSADQCTGLGGVVVDDGSGNDFCRLDITSCSSVGWTQYQSWTTTANNNCVTTLSGPTNGCTGEENYTGSCGINCNSGSHTTFANAGIESSSCSCQTCSYPAHTAYYTCIALVDQVGCY